MMVTDKCLNRPIGLIRPNRPIGLNRPIGHYSSLVARRECQIK